jgi:hypothetical protein
MQHHFFSPIGIALRAKPVWIGCLLLALSHFPSAHADIVFTLGNNPQPDEENILLTVDDTGTTISGVTNQSSVSVDFTSTQTLVVNASGQIVGDGTPLTNISIDLTGGGTFADFILNPTINGTLCPGCSGGTATVNVTSFLNGTLEGVSSFQYTLGNGLNFLTITTLGGESIGTISLLADDGFSTFSQPRISGVSPASVPEPAMLALIGVAFAAIGFARRRCRAD